LRKIFVVAARIELTTAGIAVESTTAASETIRARLLRFGVQISELLTQRKFVSAMCHAHSYAHKPPKAVAPTVLMLE